MVHRNIGFGNWDVANAKAYLWATELNSETTTEVIDNGLRCFTYNDLEKQSETNSNTFEVAKRNRSLFPHLYALWNFPSFWDRGTELHQRIDVVMHLLFLGVVKTSLKRKDAWMISLGIDKAFEIAAAEVRQDVQEL